MRSPTNTGLVMKQSGKWPEPRKESLRSTASPGLSVSRGKYSSTVRMTQGIEPRWPGVKFPCATRRASASNSPVEKSFEFLVLTAVRGAEALGARWEESAHVFVYCLAWPLLDHVEEIVVLTSFLPHRENRSRVALTRCSSRTRCSRRRRRSACASFRSVRTSFSVSSASIIALIDPVLVGSQMRPCRDSRLIIHSLNLGHSARIASRPISMATNGPCRRLR